MAGNNIRRRIYFYRLICKKNNANVAPSTIFSHINTLSFTGAGRYLNLPEGRSLSMYIDTASIPIKIKMGTIRREGLPLVEHSGTTSPLVLPRDAGLYEPVHIMIFENNIMGFESNFYGPRPGVLTFYLPAKASSLVETVEVRALIRKDILNALSRIGEIKLFEMSVQRDMHQHLARLDGSLAKAFEEMKEFTDADTLEISLKTKPYAREGISISFFNNVQRLVDWLHQPGVKEGINQLKITGIDRETRGKIEFDLLQQYLISKKQMMLQDEVHRAVNSDSAYNAIIEAYRESRDEINEILANDD